MKSNRKRKRRSTWSWSFRARGRCPRWANGIPDYPEAEAVPSLPKDLLRRPSIVPVGNRRRLRLSVRIHQDIRSTPRSHTLSLSFSLTFTTGIRAPEHNRARACPSFQCLPSVSAAAALSFLPENRWRCINKKCREGLVRAAKPTALGAWEIGF